MEERQNNFEKILISIVDDEHIKKPIKDILVVNDIEEQKAKEITDSISSTIDLIDKNYQSLKKAKTEGKTRIEWFKEQIDNTIKEKKLDNPVELIEGVKKGLANSNKEIAVQLFDTKIDLTEPLKNPEFKDVHKTAIVKNFQDDIKNNTMLGAIVFEESKIKLNKEHKEIKAVKEYFDQELDSSADKEFKKKVSAATVLAKEKGYLKPLKNKTPDEISMMVDKGVTAAKVAYKVGKGEFSPVDAVEYTIDRNVATVNSAITKVCTRVGGQIGEKAGAMIGSIFGPAGTAAGAVIGRTVGKVGGYVVGKVVGEGVKKVASAVKTVAKKAWEGVKSVSSNVWSGVKSLFSGWW